MQNRFWHNEQQEIDAFFEAEELKRAQDESNDIKKEVVRLLNIGCRVSKDTGWFCEKDNADNINRICWDFKNKEHYLEEKTTVSFDDALKVFHYFFVTNNLCSSEGAKSLANKLQKNPGLLVIDGENNDLINELYNTVVLRFMLIGESRFIARQIKTAFLLGSKDPNSAIYGFFKSPIFDPNVAREIFECSGVLNKKL